MGNVLNYFIESCSYSIIEPLNFYSTGKIQQEQLMCTCTHAQHKNTPGGALRKLHLHCLQIQQILVSFFYAKNDAVNHMETVYNLLTIISLNFIFNENAPKSVIKKCRQTHLLRKWRKITVEHFTLYYTR